MNDQGVAVGDIYGSFRLSSSILSCSQLIKIIDLMEAFQDSGEHQVI
jgi:hypothetical protein